jgi:hypothetical protein
MVAPIRNFLDFNYQRDGHISESTTQTNLVFLEDPMSLLFNLHGVNITRTVYLHNVKHLIYADNMPNKFSRLKSGI